MKVLTLNTLLTNPFGQDEHLPKEYKKLLLENLEERYRLLETNTRIIYSYNKDEDKDRYTFHIKVGSEKFHHIIYDVIIQLHGDGKTKKLIDYPCKIWSNMPWFTFRYTYVCNYFGWLADGLKGKCIAKHLIRPPKNFSPNFDISLIKDVFFAAMLLRDNNDYLKGSKKDEVKTSKMISLCITQSRMLDKRQKAETDSRVKAQNAKKYSQMSFFEKRKHDLLEAMNALDKKYLDTKKEKLQKSTTTTGTMHKIKKDSMLNRVMKKNKVIVTNKHERGTRKSRTTRASRVSRKSRGSR